MDLRPKAPLRLCRFLRPEEELRAFPPAALLDGVNLRPVPEPSSLPLSALGLLSFGALRLRRRKNWLRFDRMLT